MKLQGNHFFPVPPQSLWALIKNPVALTAVMPGCDTLIPIAENQYQGELTIPVGPMAGTYEGNLSLSHIVENESMAFTFTAQSKTGSIGGNGRLHLQEQENGTQLTYEGEAKVGGQLITFATPLLETTARSLVRQSLDNLNQIIQPDSSLPSISQLTSQTEVPSTGNNSVNQQTTILVIAAISITILFTLLYFFSRKRNANS